MRIEIPREVERFGPIMFHDVQKVYELDAGLKHARNESKAKEKSVIRRLSYESLQEIQEQMCIIVPIRNEKIKLIEGVLCGIPHHCQVIIVSNSDRAPIDRYHIERDALEHICKFMKKNVIIVHQKDPKLREACEKSGYKFLLNEQGEIKNGKAEGMILSTFLAYLSGKKYIGFIDSDNYFPGAVHEYVQEYCAGFHMAKSDYSMVRIAWHSKPKIVESNLFFAKRGRVSEHTNKILNGLISTFTGYGTEIIKTGNAGEHAMTMELAINLDYSSGYSIEPYHYINMLERFGGILDNPIPSVLNQGIEVFQIESRNPHLHEVKGEEHVDSMSMEAMEVIYRSPMCSESLKKEIMEDIYHRGLLKEGEKIKESLTYYPAIINANLKVFYEVIQSEPYAELLQIDLTDYKHQKANGLQRDQVKGKKINLPENGTKLEAK